jgi:GxxExxY protein
VNALRCQVKTWKQDDSNLFPADFADCRKFFVMTENDISYIIRGSIYKVHNNLGPGLLESVYEAAMAFELKQCGLKVRCQVPLPVVYETEVLELGFRLDMLINDLVIVEINSIDAIHEVHHKQVLTYLKLSNLKLGLLVNFNTDNISASIIRKVNKL